MKIKYKIAVISLLCIIILGLTGCNKSSDDALSNDIIKSNEIAIVVLDYKDVNN